MMVRHAVLVFCCIVLCFADFHASEESDVYFNAGTEEYLRGRFAESIDNLEKAQKLDSENRKIGEFMAKILIEAATQNHLSRNYRQAMTYLEKAKQVAPDDPKVQEMYRMTSDILNENARKDDPSKEKDAPKPAAAPRTPESREAKRPPKEKAPTVTVSVRPLSSPVRYEPQPVTGIAAGTVNAIWSAGMLLLFLMVLLIWKTVSFARLRKQLVAGEEKLKTLQEERNVLFTELEKMKERSRLEHEGLEQARLELREMKKKDDEYLRVELELRKKQIEEQVRAEVLAQYGGEGFVQRQQARLLEFAERAEQNDDSNVALESVRERISLMAENLYDYSPGRAMEYLRKAVANENPLIRSNIVRALSRIAIPETIAMLFGLFGDADYGVKREVLKSLKQLHQRVESGTLTLSSETEQKIKALIKEEKTKGEWII